MDSDIPYGERVKGDEDIEFWRRTDYWDNNLSRSKKNKI
jgi:hypothetical protein